MSICRVQPVALCIASLLLVLIPVRAQAGQAEIQDAESLAFQRAEHLQHGINASLWFAQSRDYSTERLRSFTTADDIALMEKLGFDHVRLSIDPGPLQRGRAFGDDSAFLHELDRIVKLMLAHHLAVIIDIHPESTFKADLRTGDDSVQHFAMFWEQLAAHFAPLDSEHIYFEIMNEPEQTDRFRWMGIQARVADAIRRAAPQNTIIATGAHWSGLEDLLTAEPLALPNVIYTFHDYDPFPFTHQGATWTDPHVQPLRHVPYPSTPEAVESNLDQEDSLAGQYWVEEYGLSRWDAERVQRTISFAARWSRQYHVPVYCGEFGVLRDFADPAMRAAWLHDMTTAFGENHIGWAMWDYQGGFGVVHKENGTAIPDPPVVKALGLVEKK